MSFKTLTSLAAAAAITASMIGLPGQSHAEYPNDKTVLNLVPFGAGGGTDRWARVISSSGFDYFDQGVRVQNRGGASGTVGWKHLLDQGADGYTVLMGSPTPVMAALAEKNPPFDPANVKIVAYYSIMKTTLMVPKKAEYNTWEKFIAHLKSGGDKVTVGGTMTHVLGVLQALKQLGLEDRIIPVVYSGTGKAVNDYIGGHIAMAAVTTSTALTMVDEHNAIFNGTDLDYPKKAQEALGDIPNAKSLGLKPYNPPRFFAMHPDTPDEQVAKMSAQLGKLLQDESVVKLIGKLNEEISYIPHDEAATAYGEILAIAKDNISLMK